MKIRIHWVGVEHSTNILVKKVPDGVSHEDDLEVGVVPLGSRLVLHLNQDAQCVLHRHLKCRWICSPSCSLRGWWDGTPRCTAAAALSAATETCQKKSTQWCFSWEEIYDLKKPFLLVYWRQVKLHSKLLHLGPKTIEKLEQNMKVTLSRAPDSIHWGKAVNSDPSMSTFKNIAIVWITQSPTSP